MRPCRHSPGPAGKWWVVQGDLANPAVAGLNLPEQTASGVVRIRTDMHTMHLHLVQDAADQHDSN